MSSIYPNSIDGYAQLPLVVDTVTHINAVTVNRLRSAIVNIETELGIQPSGTYTDVRERLDALEDRIGSIETLLTELLGDDFLDFTSRLDQLFAITAVSVDTTLDETYGTVLVDASGGNITISLPSAVGETRIYNIKKIDSTDNLVIIEPFGSETLDGESNFYINYQYDSYSIINDNSAWFNI